MPGRPAGGESAQPVSVFTFHLGLRVFQDLPLRDEHQVRARKLVPAIALPEQALGAVARHRTPEPSRRGQAQAPVTVRVVGGHQREEGAVQPQSLPQDALELGSRAQPFRRGKALSLLAGGGGYAPIRLRPFCRRRFSTRRPPLVRMRTRNPWVLFRLRLFGWNVRFMLSPGRFGERPSAGGPYRTKD
jgi:hypothetical protein